MAKPSNKMLKVTKSIESTLGVSFEGDRSSFNDVKEFLDKYIDQWKKALDDSEPSDNQLNGVKLIEDKLGIKYQGPNTRKGVSDFLNQYLSEAVNSGNSKKGGKKGGDKPPNPFD